MAFAKDLNIYVVGHLGLIGTFIKECNLINEIDQLLGKIRNQQSNLTHGEVISLLILNLLGFTYDDTSLSNLFFKNKDLEAILGKDCPKYLFTNEAIQSTLDAVHKYGIEEFFSKVNSHILKYIGKKLDLANIDSSLILQSKFNNPNPDEYTLKISYDFDQKFKQEPLKVIMHMLIDQPSGMPLYISFDKEPSLSSSINILKAFKQATNNETTYFKLDQSLYEENTLSELTAQNIKFLSCLTKSRSKEIKQFINEHQNDPLEFLEPNVSGKIYINNIHDLPQQMLLICESKPQDQIMHKSEQELRKLNKVIKSYEDLLFTDPKEAEQEIEKLKKKCKYCKVIKEKITKSSEHNRDFYQIDLSLEIDQERYNATQKDFYVIATNDLNCSLTPLELLHLFKTHHKLDRGFRFLPCSYIYADCSYPFANKNLQEISMLMALCLSIYNGFEWKINNILIDTNSQLKNKIGKDVDHIKMDWIFSKFYSIMTIVYKNGQRLFDLNGREERIKLLSLLGKNWQKSYGIDD